MQQGFQLYGLGRLAESKVSFLAAAEIKNQDPNPFVALFQTQLDMRDYKGALISIKQALSLRDNNPDIWKKYIDLEQNQLVASNDEVNSLYIEAVNKTAGHPNHADILVSYAIFLEKSGNLQGAIEYWQKALAVNPAGKAQYQAEIERLKERIR